MGLEFANFRTVAIANGLTARECSWSHWQLLGGIRPVNVHLNQKREISCIYINGSVKGVRTKLSVQAAIEAAKNGTLTPAEKVERLGQKAAAKIRRKIWEGDRRCHWCRRPLSWEETTLEHLIPLEKGGSNQRDNLAIACEPCNKEHGGEATWPISVVERAVDFVFTEMGAARD